MKTKTFFLLISACILHAISSQAQDVSEYANNYLDASPEHPYDVTHKVTNATCTENFGWNRHSSDAAAGYNKYNSDFNSSVYSGTGIESWYWSPQKNCDLIWQDVENLMPGKYLLRAYGVGQVYNDNARKGQNVGTLYLRGGNEMTVITSNKWQETELNCNVKADGKLRIGIYAGTDNANDWVSIANVRLYCIGAELGKTEPLALNEDYDVNAIRSDMSADVYLSKHLTSERFTWICLPFSMTDVQTQEWFREVRKATSATMQNNEITLETQTVTQIEAGVPYLVKTKENTPNMLHIGQVFVIKSTPATVNLGNGISLVGTYRREEGIENTYIPTGDGKTFIKNKEKLRIKGFNAYLQVSNP